MSDTTNHCYIPAARLSPDIELELALLHMHGLERVMQRTNPASDPEGYAAVLYGLADAYSNVMRLQALVDVNDAGRWALLVVDSSVYEDHNHDQCHAGVVAPPALGY